MTPLTKSIRRLTRAVTDRKGNLAIVSLEPGDMLEFRMKGKRRSVSIHLGHCLNLATLMQGEHDFNEAMKEYTKLKKAGRQFLRRPKRSSFPFSPIYFKALKA